MFEELFSDRVKGNHGKLSMLPSRNPGSHQTNMCYAISALAFFPSTNLHDLQDGALASLTWRPIDPHQVRDIIIAAHVSFPR